jgi:ribosome-associated protein
MRNLTLTNSSASVLDVIERCLDETKAQDVVVIPLDGQSAVADYMIVATGHSQRQLGAMAARISHAVMHPVGIEGIPDCDWVCVDAGDVIVHLFKPETRGFYNLEKMWGASLPQSEAVFV